MVYTIQYTVYVLYRHICTYLYLLCSYLSIFFVMLYYLLTKEQSWEFYAHNLISYSTFKVKV